ncbi:hypothetical protein [Bradyrhizobium sp. WSM4349]|uniref:hypothetical protein n=1 Tax=Bradyrhizobium sp. WSM4349 TaxID=1040988 RepID=UPI00039B29A9|nr:hypothetical protein [Bradyrhizobium sp. WSM4349]
MDDLAMLLAELERCKAEFEHLQTELNSPRGAGPVQPTTLEDLARRMSEIAARLEAATRAISKGPVSGIH